MALALALLLGAPAHAQAPDPSDPTSATPATLHGALRLSLEDAIAMGLKNNLDVEVSRHDPLATWEEFRSAWGAYDPQLFAEFGYESTETPVASALQASSALTEREVGGQGGVRGKIPWLNATYGVGYDGSSVETTSSINDLSPEYRASISAQASIPLLKNLIWDRDWTRLKQTEILYNISNEDFRRSVMDTVQTLESAYWNLVATDDAVRVAEKSLETAEALLRQTKTQYEVGVVSRVEVTEAEAGLAEREVNLIRVRNAYRRAQDMLMNEVLGRGLRPGSRMEIDPTTRPDDYIVYQIDVVEATHKAFENRPELAQAYDEIERRKIELSFRKNQKLPQLDLQLRYWLQGLSGKTNPAPTLFGGARTPALVGPNYRNAHDDYFTGDRADSWSAMGVVSFPIGNRAAGHQAAAPGHHPGGPGCSPEPGVGPGGHRGRRAPADRLPGAAPRGAHPPGTGRIHTLRRAVARTRSGGCRGQQDRRAACLPQLGGGPGPASGHDPAHPQHPDR
jgi:outer membrane protein TolC